LHVTPVPNYSTWSQNYIRRYKDSEIFDTIFRKIIEQAISHGFLDTETIFGDSTHVKASANKRKSTSEEVELTKKKFEDDLLDEINEVRRQNGQKEFDSLRRTEYDFDEETGEVTERVETKTVKQSTTDPESGWFHKGEHKDVFAYAVETACDENGWIIDYTIHPGNEHDSMTFPELYRKLKRFSPGTLVMDAGYKNPPIAKMLLDDKVTPVFPYTRPKTREGFFRKNEYVYDEYFDCYLCPNGQILKYSTTNREGYREYKSDPQICRRCPHLEQCTQNKNHQKTVTRHIWQEHLEICEEIRHRAGMKELYGKRKETIERDFGTAKEHHGMRYTQQIGKEKMAMKVGLTFACMNMKKLANILWIYRKTGSPDPNNSNVSSFARLIRRLTRPIWLISPVPYNI
jgi:hypothetical protein